MTQVCKSAYCKRTLGAGSENGYCYVHKARLRPGVEETQEKRVAIIGHHDTDGLTGPCTSKQVSLPREPWL